MVTKASTLHYSSRTHRLVVPQYGAPRAASSAIPAKRLSKLRVNWFIIGSVCGIAMSFFMNVVFTSLILPHYRSFRALEHPELATLRDVPTRLAQQKIAKVQAKPIIEAKAPPPPPPPSYPLKVALKVSSGDTLLTMLLKQNVPSQEAHQVVNTLKKEFNPGMLRVGQRISLTLDKHERLNDRAAVKELAIRLPSLTTVELARLKEGTFSLAAERVKMVDTPYRAVGKVRSSLYQAAADAGIPSATMAELVRAFSYDIDFQREIHPGDTIEVLMNRKVAESGEAAMGGASNVRYAALTLHGKKHEIYHFADSSGLSGWFDARGNSVKKSLLKTPMNAARISSGYGMRRHPVLGYSKMHRGVDFAARTGTPILAAGDGVVTYRGWKGGYGNYVQVKHNATYQTAYGHISRFHPSVKNGSRVKQGQVIAYVGSTGMSTGPHLHFEVLQAGRQVNPTAQKFNTSQALAGAQMQRFKARMASMRSELAKLQPNQITKPAAPQQVAMASPSKSGTQ